MALEAGIMMIIPLNNSATHRNEVLIQPAVLLQHSVMSASSMGISEKLSQLLAQTVCFVSPILIGFSLKSHMLRVLRIECIYILKWAGQ